MESGSQSDSDGGGGGHHGWSSLSLTSLLRTSHDDGRPQPRPPQAQDGPSDPGMAVGQPSLPAVVLSLDQIRASGNSNEYTEGPTVAQRSPASLRGQQKTTLASPPASGTSLQQETPDERPNNQWNLLPLNQHGAAHPSIPREAPESSSDTDSLRGVRISVGSSPSTHMLLVSPAVSEEIIRTQPKHAEQNSDELKPLSDVSVTVTVAPGGAEDGALSKHSYRCQSCGRCRCAECTRPRMLPSCWMCGRRCVCSAQSSVEYGTCVCCVKGLFYHCSSDDEDTCADKPFSCTQSHCCVRWTTVSLLSILFPCILCYLPAKGCLAACQSCYDRVSRPGCQCKSANMARCGTVSKPT